MVVIIANSICPYTRGILRRWFLEPKPYVFVSNVNKKNLDSIIKYIKNHNCDFSLLIFVSDKSTQGFKIIQENFLLEEESNCLENNCGVNLIKKLKNK